MVRVVHAVEAEYVGPYQIESVIRIVKAKIPVDISDGWCSVQ